MAPAEIPGYYYDEEKKKYFKVQKSHTAQPGSTHTAEAVRKRKVEKAAEEAREHALALRKDNIKRARVLQDGLLGGALGREHGILGRGAHRRYQLKGYVDSWTSWKVFKSSKPGHANFIGLPNVEHKTGSYFDFDVEGGTLFYAENRNSLRSIAVNGTFPSKLESEAEKEPARSLTFNKWQFVDLETNENSMISSVSFNPETRHLLTTWQDPWRGQNMHLRKVIMEGFQESRESVENGTENLPPRAQAPVNIRMTRGARETPTIWTSCIAPLHSPFSFAISTDCGIITISKDMHDIKWLNRNSPSVEYTALTFLSQSPTTLLAATRPGDIQILDYRAPWFEARETAIRHPISLGEIKQLNDVSIVVSGLENTLCIYDLRFLARPANHNAPVWEAGDRPRARSKYFKNTTCTIPSLIFPDHRNPYFHDVGMDVDRDMGLVAAAQVDGVRNPVKVFSSLDGSVVRTLETENLRNHGDGGHSSCVRFVEDVVGGPRSLVFNKGGSINGWAW